MKQLRKVSGLSKALLMIGLILSLSLFFVIKTKPGGQVGENTVSPVISPSHDVLETPTSFWLTPFWLTSTIQPSSMPSSTATSTLQPPQCTFPLANTQYPESKPEEYTFSEPQVVLSALRGNIYNIIEWLPDNQQVLMTEELRNVVIENNVSLKENISLYNPETGDIKVYAVRSLTNGSFPAWQPGLNAVVYPDMNYFDVDRNAGIYKFNRELLVSYGDTNNVQLLVDNLSEFSIAFKPGGNETAYLSDKKISKLDELLEELQSIPFDSTKLDYEKKQTDENPILYEMAWQPETELIFLYSNGGDANGYTFILNSDTGYICELDLGGWATMGRWSPDGRYLAVSRATNSHPPDLTLLDSNTGQLITLDTPPAGIDGKLYISDFIWAPDNHYLLTLGNVYLSQNNEAGSSVQDQGLYLVDLSKQSSFIGTYAGIMSPQDNNWAWSSDGSKLLMRCPTRETDQICLISIHQTEQ